MKEISPKKQDAFIAMCDAFITTTSSTLNPIEFQQNHKLATVMSFHFGVFSVVGSFLNFDQDELRMAMYKYFYMAANKNAHEAAYLVREMFAVGSTDIGKDVMQHGAFAYDAWINGDESATMKLRQLIDGAVAADKQYDLDRMQEWSDGDEDWTDDEMPEGDGDFQ